jgi:hypothetical protein
MRGHALLLAGTFALAIGLLLGGRAAQAGPAPDEDPFTDTLTVIAGDPPAVPAGASELTLQTTVGLDPNCLGATQAITVPAGTLVTFCYHVVNNTPYTLTTHTLRDQYAENILNEASAVLGPGASTNWKRSQVVSASAANVATWTATLPIGTYAAILASCTNYPDITGTGQNLNLDDDEVVNLSLPFHFPFYDRYSNRLRVSENGVLLFDEPNAPVGFGNVSLPTAGLPHGLAAFWDDLTDETGQVAAGLFDGGALLADAPPGLQPQIAGTYYVVEYRNRSVYPGPSNTGTFAVLLSAPGQGSDGVIIVCYKDTFFARADSNYGKSATLGVNHNSGVATLWSYNTEHTELTGTFGILYMPVGSHHAFADSDGARVNAITTIRLPIIQR